MNAEELLRTGRARMFLRALGACAVVTLAGLGTSVCGQNSTSPSQTLTELQQQLKSHVSEPRFDAALWGVKVVSLASGKTVFENNASRLFSPASNCKLYTVALALDRLGAEYKIGTSLYAEGMVTRQGKLKGSLVLFGRGDPTLTAHLYGDDPYRCLAPFVAAVKQAGIKRVAGDIVGDESFFKGPDYGSGWVWDDLENDYGAEISALTINDNTFQLEIRPGEVGQPARLRMIPEMPGIVLSNRTRTGSSGARRVEIFHPLNENVFFVTGQIPAGDNSGPETVPFHDPARQFAAMLKRELTRQGIKVEGAARGKSWLDTSASTNDFKGRELVRLESLPLGVIAREIMKPSQNLYTDLILAHVGESKRTPADGKERTSEELGIRELNEFMKEIGVGRGEVLFEEGSGLSRNNLTTPNATVRLLQFMAAHKEAQAYFEALPIAGVDGTLRRRMKDTAAEGNLRAKTGTLRWANSLSGYLTTKGGDKLAFCIMLNRFRGTEANEARAAIDYIAVNLCNFSGKID